MSSEFLCFDGGGDGFVYPPLDKCVFAYDFIKCRGIRVFLYLT